MQVTPSNCVQCGAITAKGGRLTPPEGGSGPRVHAARSAFRPSGRPDAEMKALNQEPTDTRGAPRARVPPLWLRKRPRRSATGSFRWARVRRHQDARGGDRPRTSCWPRTRSRSSRSLLVGGRRGQTAFPRTMRHARHHDSARGVVQADARAVDARSAARAEALAPRGARAVYGAAVAFFRPAATGLVWTRERGAPAAGNAPTRAVSKSTASCSGRRSRG